MDTSIVGNSARRIGDMMLRNSPTILTGLGVAGLVTTVIMAIKVTPKAVKILAWEKDRREKECIAEGHGLMPDPIKVVDVVKLTWRCYAPVAAMGVTTAACIIGSNSINLRRNAALASLYSLSEMAMKEYQAKVVETIGEKKEAKMKDEMAQDKLDKNPVNDQQVIITGKGETLCYDSLSGRYFKNDVENIKRIQNEFNIRLLHDMYRPLNELYDDLGLEGTKFGAELGWTTEYGLLDIVFSSKLATDGQPCLVLEYRMGPRQM